MKKFLPVLLVVLIAAGAVAWWQFGARKPVVDDTGNAAQKANLIRLDSPRPGAEIKSPLTITGQARGYWYFEASFPVVLVDWDGRIIAQGIATAKDEWMTENFVPFEATITFTSDNNANCISVSLIF